MHAPLAPRPWLIPRLLLLLLACLLPTTILFALVQRDQRAQLRAETERAAIQEADLLAGDLGSLADGAHAVLITAAELAGAIGDGPACNRRLEAINEELPVYEFFAKVDGSGRVTCSSYPALAAGAAAGATWATDSLSAARFQAGRYATLGTPESAFMPFVLPLGTADHSNGAMIAALSLAWLGEHLHNLPGAEREIARGATFTVADREGTILARLPQGERHVGRKLPASQVARMNADRGRSARLTEIDGVARVVGFSPLGPPGLGLLATAALLEREEAANLDRLATINAALLAATVALVLLLAALIGHRLVGGPAAALLAAARALRAGDLRARAVVEDPRSEFGRVALAYNLAADEIERRLAASQDTARAMEVRVSEGTAALLESNDLLQTEIGRRRQIEADLVQAQKLQAMGQLSGGIAHDFNNLLGTILGSLELLDRDLGAEQARQRAMIQRASRAVQRGADLTARLLAFARRRPFAVQSTDVNRVIQDLGALLAASQVGRRVQIERHLQADLWPALVEQSQLEAAILNLVLNARDAMPQGGRITISTANETQPPPAGERDLAAGDYVRITVSDTGTGMTEEVQRRAFDPFFTTKGTAGSGLGLAQVYASTRQAGGRARIDSSGDRGTSITLLFPRAPSEPAAAAREAGLAKVRPCCVLLLEDDAAMRQVAADMLTSLGCLVIDAKDGPQALARLGGGAAGARPDFALLDETVASVHVGALIAEARSSGFAGKFVLLRGPGEAADAAARSAVPEGQPVPDAVLDKPFTLSALAEAIAALQA